MIFFKLVVDFLKFLVVIICFGYVRYFYNFKISGFIVEML